MASKSEEALKIREFNMCCLGTGEVGKTSLLSSLAGRTFSRKSKYQPSMGDEPAKFSIEVASSAGTLLFNIYDWAWEEKRREACINQQLMKGRDGALFVYDVTDRRSKSAFNDFSDWYQRAAGYEKPWMIVSTKNDQKKHAVQDGEGRSLARDGTRRMYAPINLVDEEGGVDDMVLALARLMVDDLNLVVSGFGPASPAVLEWSLERATQATASIGMGMENLANEKTKRVLLVVLNSSVAAKFLETLNLSEYMLETVGSVDMCVSEIDSPEDPLALPVAAIMVPPSASESQKIALGEVAKSRNVSFVVSIPRNALDVLRGEK